MLDGSFDCYYYEQKGHNKKWLVKNIFGKSKANAFVDTQICKLLLHRIIGYLNQQEFIRASMVGKPAFTELRKSCNGICYQETIDRANLCQWLHETGLTLLQECAVHSTSRYRISYVELVNDCKAFVNEKMQANATK